MVSINSLVFSPGPFRLVLAQATALVTLAVLRGPPNAKGTSYFSGGKQLRLRSNKWWDKPWKMLGVNKKNYKPTESFLLKPGETAKQFGFSGWTVLLMILEICYLDNLEFEIWNASFFWSPDHHQTPLSFEDLDFQPSWGLQEVGKVMGRVQGHPPWKIWFLQAMLILRRPDPQGKIGRAWQWNVILMWFTYGYGSIPMKNTIFRGMNIHKSQLFWCTGVQGFDTLPYIYIHFKPLTTICNILSSTIISHHDSP